MNKIMEESEYKHIWQILNALIDQDTDLSDVVKHIGRLESQQTSLHNNMLTEYIHLCNMPKELETLISSHIIDRYADNWYVMYDNLKVYYEHNKTFIVKNNKKLSQWTSWQREQYKINGLSADKLRLLKNIKFPWNALDALWLEQFEVLKTMPEANDMAMGGWKLRQKIAFANKKLDTEQIEALNSIGFDFVIKDSPEEKNLNLFIKFLKQKPVPYLSDKGSDANMNRLAAYAKRLRHRDAHNRLSSNVINKLNKANPDWKIIVNFKENKWLMQYERFKAWKQINPNVSDRNHKNPGWVNAFSSAVRILYKKGTIPSYRIKMLNDIGFKWGNETLRPEVIKYLEQLKACYKLNKTWTIPARVNGKKNNIYYWLYEIKNKYHTGLLNQNIEDALNKIGFDFNAK